MGQQQLLLLVLGIVIVGIAAVAGMAAFGEGRNKAERDAAISDAMRLVQNVQAWKLKPTSSGGGASANGFTGVTMAAAGVSPNASGHYVTANGCFTLTPGPEAVVGVYGYRSDCTSGKIADITIAGSDPSNLSWVYAP